MRLRILAAAGLLAASFAAHADTFQTFTTYGTVYDDPPNYEGSYTLTVTSSTGTAQFDVDTEYFTSVTVPFGYGNYTFDNDSSADFPIDNCEDFEYECAVIPFGENYFSFQYSNPGLEIYDQYGNYNLEYIYGGGGIGSEVTPEPSSFALLGTGLLGLAGVVKRRFA